MPGATAADTLLERNFAEGAADDGFDVESGATTLTKNTANHNEDGNRAGGNGNPLQCTNVFCK